MSKQILKCQRCGAYTLNEICKCGGRAVTVRPLRYSPQDPYAEYRRKAKESERRQQGLIP